MRTTSNFAALLVVGATALMSSCAPDATTPADGTRGESSSAPASTSITAAEGSAATVSSDQIDSGLQPYIEVAMADLATRLAGGSRAPFLCEPGES